MRYAIVNNPNLAIIASNGLSIYFFLYDFHQDIKFTLFQKGTDQLINYFCYAERQIK